jgi:hypothetical protein
VRELSLDSSCQKFLIERAHDVHINEFLNATEFGNILHTNAVINTRVSLNSRLNTKVCFSMVHRTAADGARRATAEKMIAGDHLDDGRGCSLSAAVSFTSMHMSCEP